MTPQLSWRSALRIAWRELGASRARFLFVIVAVAVGVASLTGVRGFSRSFRHMLLSQARTLMAADLTARVFALPTPHQQAELDFLASRGVQRTWITETLTVDQNIEPGARAHRPIHRGFVGYVEDQRRRTGQPGRQGLGARAIDIGNRDRCPRAGQHAADLFPDAAGAAGDQRGAPIQTKRSCHETEL